MRDKGLWALSAVCGAAYFVTQPWMPYPGSFVIKGLAIATLAVIVFRAGASASLRILALAFLLSAVGDVLLDLDPQKLFVYGLGSFLIVHLLYTAVFWRNRPRPLAPGAGPLAAVAVVLAYCGFVCGWLFPSLGNLQVPVAIYMGAITAMVVSAILGRFRRRAIVWGALLFLVSDSLLAINRFKTPVPYRDFLVWSTYYLGQCGIAWGCVFGLGADE